MSLPSRPLHGLTRRIWRGEHFSIGIINVASCSTTKKPKNPDKISPNVDQPKIVIVGAGIAGLSAAKLLANSGITNFTVLEGSDRPGGRIHSCTVGDTVAELGAQWIKGGSEANPVLALACSEGLLKDPITKRPSLASRNSLLCLTSDGKFIDRKVSSEGIRLYNKLEDQASSLFSSESLKGHGTLKHFLKNRATDEISRLPKAIQKDVSKVVNGLFNRLKGRWGENLHKMSSDRFGCFTSIPGEAVHVPSGFVSVLGHMIREIPKWTIRYDAEVKSIRWGCGHPRAVVRTCDGQEFPADYIIVTVPLGVLKEHYETLFQPALPESKIQAIQNLGYGHSNKIFLEYSNPFWLEGEGTLLFAWSAEEIEEKNSWLKGISVIEEVPETKNMLMMTVGGPEAKEMERETEEEIACSFTELLHKFTGDSSLPLPVNLFRSKWSGNRFSLGTNSYMAVPSKLKDICELSAPVVDSCHPGPPVLLFAGEATSPMMYSTVHGARLSGLREAGRIVGWTKKLCGPPIVSCP